MKTINTGVNFAGLNLKNPIIVESSELTDSTLKIKILEESGVAAIIIQSIYEEQIMMSLDRENEIEAEENFTNENIKNLITRNHLDIYLNKIKEYKSISSIPIIASVNCHTNRDWVKSLKEMEIAGADAIELHLTLLDPSMNEKCVICDIIASAKKNTQLPIILKINGEFENCFSLINKCEYHADAVIINKSHFSNRLRKEVMESNFVFSIKDLDSTQKSDNHKSSLSNINNTDIAISQNINTIDDIIAGILCGAKAIAVNSMIYKLGPDYIPHIISYLTDWMKENNYEKIEDFRGLIGSESHDFCLNFN